MTSGGAGICVMAAREVAQKDSGGPAGFSWSGPLATTESVEGGTRDLDQRDPGAADFEGSSGAENSRR